MKQKFIEIGKWTLQIVLTALASAAIALLQKWVEAHGVPAGPEIQPQDTAAIGTLIQGARIGLKQIRLG